MLKMPIMAKLEEIRDEGDTKSLGTLSFLQLPAPGDRIEVHRGTAYAEMIVLYVLHRPVPEGQGEPGATVYGQIQIG
ncbi:hypothetical protein [Bradyrhizobium sp. Ec3.3]|uniref:hypothetical protein n=1 Tax=Bradyrhizobium sp. Ec3.3 TaxID=189753 RepID=UPI0012EC5AF7|nr:hypothetical protein [Bradyrhizobium sp. Ec3.3]